MPFAEAQYPVKHPGWIADEHGDHRMYVTLPNGEPIVLEYSYNNCGGLQELAIGSANSYPDGSLYPARWVCEITYRGVLVFPDSLSACKVITAPKEGQHA